MCDGKSTREYLHDLRQEHVSTHCRMTNKNLWIERVFKGRFLNKSFTGNTTKIKANLNVKKNLKKSPVKRLTGDFRDSKYLMCYFRQD